jgi:CO/xanthine dehydrogenase Mo-binding subunit
MEQVNITMADTETTPPGHVTAGSTTTFTTGAAVEMAAQSVRNRLLERAAAELGASNAVMEGGRFQASGRGQDAPGSGGDGHDSPRGGLSFADAAALLDEPIIGRGSLASGSKDFIVNSFCAHFSEVEVDMESGRIRILRYVAVHDSGRLLHPRMAENQVSGGVLQFLGIALREEMLLDEGSGATLNPGFLEHKFTSIVDFPPVEVLFAGEPDPIGPFGAKALGEPPVVPVFAAVANAVANACGIWLHETPFTPQRVLQAIHDQSGGEHETF